MYGNADVWLSYPRVTLKPEAVSVSIVYALKELPLMVAFIKYGLVVTGVTTAGDELFFEQLIKAEIQVAKIAMLTNFLFIRFVGY